MKDVPKMNATKMMRLAVFAAFAFGHLISTTLAANAQSCEFMPRLVSMEDPNDNIDERRANPRIEFKGKVVSVSDEAIVKIRVMRFLVIPTTKLMIFRGCVQPEILRAVVVGRRVECASSNRFQRPWEGDPTLGKGATIYSGGCDLRVGNSGGSTVPLSHLIDVLHLATENGLTTGLVPVAE